MNVISSRLESLREWMLDRGIGVFIVPTADPHGSEYVPDYWKCREWLTGFNGSAGTAVVTSDEALLWTDSRYFIQAEEQLRDTPFVLMREGVEDVPTLIEWVREHMNGTKAGAPALMVNHGFGDAFENECETSGNDAEAACSVFIYTEDPFEALWPDRPQMPKGRVIVQHEAHTALSAKEKVQQLAPSEDSAMLLLTDLSDIAWTLNLRGSDIEYNPVFLSYLLIGKAGVFLCIDEEKLTAEARAMLDALPAEILPYDRFEQALDRAASNGADTIVLPEETNAHICRLISQREDFKTIHISSPVAPLKAVKDAKEQEGFRQAMERDGVALVKFRRWLDEALCRGEALTEQEIDRRLTDYRAEQKGFESLSFGTIAAAGPHGAIVHYEAEPKGHTPLPNHSLLLLDSGAQYDCGTTDITRTIPLGPLTEKEREVYTLVMKAHIGLARLRFPEGTNGLQADTAARAPLWQAGYDFGHGTGHGVGSHLCVHEGPHQIRKDKRLCTAVTLRPGMTVTDEPGVYLEGEFGVRLENVLLVRKDPDGFLRFEALTLCPFDTSPIIREMLTHEELDYLNAYHAEVRRRLLSLLTEEADRQWLIAATDAI